MMAFGGAWLYFQTVKTVWDETYPWQRHWLFLGQPTHPWSQARNPLDHYRDRDMHLGGVFGTHLWINAIAFDVLLSGVVLALWSWIANLDAKGMVRCSLFPWWDEVIEKAKLWRYRGLSEARTSGGLRGGSRAGLRGGATRSGAEYLLRTDEADASSSDEDEQPPVRKRPQKKTSRPPSRGPAPAQPATQGRRTRSTSARAASQQPEEPERSRSRSTGRKASFHTSSRRSGISRVGCGVSPSPGLSDIAESTSSSSTSRSERIRGRRHINDTSSSDSSDDEEEDETLELDDGPAFRDRAGQAEQAGLALALFAVGGLGMASAAVFGAEELGDGVL